MIALLTSLRRRFDYSLTAAAAPSDFQTVEEAFRA